MSFDLGPAAIFGWVALPRQPGTEIELAGAAFLLSPTMAVTCAHVIRDHLGLTKTPELAPADSIAVRFEAADLSAEATVAANGWYPDNRSGPANLLRDVAFLRLKAPIQVEGLRHLSLAPWVPRGGKAALVIGAEPGYQQMSQNVPVKLAENTNNRGLWQLDASREVGFKVVRGFSGAPLLDDAGTVFWGMIIEVDAKGRPVAFAVGADRLYEAHEQLRSARAAGTDGRSFPHLIPPDMRALQEQIQQANLERDAARRELENLRQISGASR